MKFISLFFCFFFVVLRGSFAYAESLFDEKTKDAASSVVVQVQEDRPVRQEENRRYIEHSRDYLGEKIAGIERKMEEFSKRLESLESKTSSESKK